MLVVNTGHRDYGYKSNITSTPTSLTDITVERSSLKKGHMGTIVLAGSIVVAYLLLDTGVVEAAPYIDTSPIDKLTNIAYDALKKISIYIATPLLAWSGITLATSGTNTGRRTTAKQIIQWTVIGIGVIVGAPWMASMIFKIWNGIF